MAKTERKRHYYSPEFKRDAVELVEKGDRTLADVARTLSITAAILGRWNQELIASGEDAFPGQGQQSGSHNIRRFNHCTGLLYLGSTVCYCNTRSL